MLPTTSSNMALGSRKKHGGKRKYQCEKYMFLLQLETYLDSYKLPGLSFVIAEILILLATGGASQATMVPAASTKNRGPSLRTISPSAFFTACFIAPPCMQGRPSRGAIFCILQLLATTLIYLFS